MSTKPENPVCPYCNNLSELVKGARIYPNWPTLADADLYVCFPCDARVGCHKGTLKPLGRLANKPLRDAKQLAHAAFDPLWKRKAAQEGISKGKARDAGYKWLANEMNIPARECHIGMFDIAQCLKVVEICKPHLR